MKTNTQPPAPTSLAINRDPMKPPRRRSTTATRLTRTRNHKEIAQRLFDMPPVIQQKRLLELKLLPPSFPLGWEQILRILLRNAGFVENPPGVADQLPKLAVKRNKAVLESASVAEPQAKVLDRFRGEPSRGGGRMLRIEALEKQIKG